MPGGPMVNIDRTAGRVTKRSSDPYGEALAAAIGQIPALGIMVVPVQAIAGNLLVFPFVAGPTLAEARRLDDHEALGRFWAFDLLIDNGDRLLKGANASNFIVADDGVLHGIDQTIGPSARGSFARGQTVTTRRLAPLHDAATRRIVSRAIFDDLSRNAPDTEFGGGHLFCARFETGLLHCLRAIARISFDDIRSAVTPFQQHPDCPHALRDLEGLRGIASAVRRCMRNLQ